MSVWKWSHYTITEAVEPFKLHLTSMSYIYEVFDHLKQLWMGIWQHTHTTHDDNDEGNGNSDDNVDDDKDNNDDGNYDMNSNWDDDYVDGNYDDDDNEDEDDDDNNVDGE